MGLAFEHFLFDACVLCATISHCEICVPSHHSLHSQSVTRKMFAVENSSGESMEEMVESDEFITARRCYVYAVHVFNTRHA